MLLSIDYVIQLMSTASKQNLFKRNCVNFFAEIVNCSKPPTTSNGAFIYTDTIFGSRATLICKRGFGINGSGLYTCDQSNIWVGSGRCGKFYTYSIEL